MLGMLSCVFSKFQADKFSSTKANLGDRYVDMGSSAVSFSPSPSGQRYLDSYFPSAEVARSILKPKTSDLPMYLDPTKVIGISRSGNSSIGASNSDPSTPFSTDGTPPSVLKPSRTTFERTSSQTTSISTSPEQNRQTHRSSSNLASAFAASLYRPFSFTTSASSSPPTTYPKKRLSPAGSYLSSTPTGVTWGATSFMGKSSTKTENIRSSYSRSHSDVKEEVTTRKPVFEVRLKNQDRFHNNGYATVPLLDQDQEWRYRAYRESYAHMLYVWKMPFERCELLKFNKTTSTSSRSADQRMKPSPLAIGKSAANFLSRNISLGLDLRRHCRSCSNVIPPQNYSQDCSFCASSQTPLVCLFCTSLIQGLASPCLSCGHTLHLSCRSTLISFTSISSHDGYCISGCGCNCASHAVVEVEYPTRRKSSASITVTGDSMTEQESNLWHDPCQEDEDIWEDVAYESLARNLGARYLTPRPSQIWRGSG